MAHIPDMTKLFVLEEMEERQRLIDERREISKEIRDLEKTYDPVRRRLAILRRKHKQYGTELAKRPISDIVERHGITFPTAQNAIRRWSPLKRIYGLK